MSPSRAAVLGSPIAHSLSPSLHRAAYAALGLDDWRYDAVEVDEAGMAGFLAGLDASWRGLSLTMPLKRVVRPLLVAESDLAREVGAVEIAPPLAAPQCIMALRDLARLGEEGAAGLGKRDAALVAEEELHPQLRLKLLNVQRHRRLRIIQLPRRAQKTPLADHRLKRLQLPQLHLTPYYQEYRTNSSLNSS